MLLADHAAKLEKSPEFQIFASDIDDQAISTARTGSYPTAIMTDVPPSLLRQFFAKVDGRYTVRKAVRDRVLFASHNLLRDPPFSRLDLISCRNLLIYLNRDMQMRVMEMFHSALNPNGFLFLGSSESAEAAAEFFTPFDKKNRIYRARTLSRAPRYAPLLPQPSSAIARLPYSNNAGASMARQYSYGEVYLRALARSARPSVMVDRDLNIVHVAESAGAYLRYVNGELTRNLISIVRPELRLELRTALYQVQQGNGDYKSQPVTIPRGDLSDSVTMTVERIQDDIAGAEFMLITFDASELQVQAEVDSAPMQHKDLLLTQMEEELQRTRERLQETIEHSEVATEELRASNEELQAINEELRSATEELETSKEELQSVNEELITVNYELKIKVDETSKANDDLNNLIASTDIATIFVDRGMRIKRFTPRAADIFSIIPSDIGRSLLDITHRLEYRELADDVGATFETLRVVERELRSNNGRYFIARLLPYRTTEDKIEGAVLTFFDVTGRREAEAKVRTGEEWMRLVAESTGDYAIMTLDTEGKVTGWNRGAEINFGYRESEMLGKPLDIIFTEEDRASNVPMDEMRRARDEGRAEDQRWHLRKDGSRLYCHGVLTPLDNGMFVGYAKIARDNTEQARAQNQREAALNDEQRSRNAAEIASAMKDEFLAVMSHELRHPLNLIYINAEMLSRLPDIHKTPSAIRALTLIRDSVTSQAKIISDLLDISRLSTGKLTLSCKTLELTGILEKWIDMLRTDPLVSALQISCDRPQVPLPVYVDEIRIEQVILNLLNNAVKFTPPGGSITVHTSKDAAFARVDIVDTGIGIAEQHLPTIFDMYEQGGKTAQRSASGLGIGLALVRQIVELHNGKVKASSRGIGQGSTFSLWLPLHQHAAGDQPANGSTLDCPLTGCRILLLDDMQDSLYLFKELLEMDGAIVCATTSAREALDILEHQSFDLLMSDISMPDMDGYAFMRAVRVRPGLQKIPAIAITGLGQEKDILLAEEAGFSDHITKPVSLDLIREKIARVLVSSR